ncbi:hypothetical protein [Bacteroides caccae]|jgi:hypothetical protein|uniref:hypothetical protein n=1 Tax=Bacteroides caccae TaxID=47678 RepID=UPI0001546525|nr:hypothetical protein [Bacteroides caccae]DAK96472.1 MAG TPA: hypothetical protein [Caudoviricetes sp.]ASM66387.1 hypothetical protein CGC64_10765 [Bacteroides caccae]EDM22780.1 hypothetical protein BACCAC_01173 [Bacteroides caccae ATCC 43185]MDC7280933.1 hypothetical protein [Bacteroides caccae]PQL34907.1 hypothetical protein C5Z00_09530 [Bacteroides caccae]
MGFTTPCFIRKNTPELRKKLEELGYYLHPECIDDDRGNYLFVNREYYLNRPLGYLEELSRSIDCGANEELFLSIASLRDDTDKYQWFTDGDKWIMCPEIKFSTYWAYNDIDVNTDTIHKATVKELIEHFKEKEVNHG